MKQARLFLLSFLALWPGVAFVDAGENPGASPPGPKQTTRNESAGYVISRNVIGSGGVNGAKSQRVSHSGTAGQMAIGRLQSTNYVLRSGFWGAPTNLTEVNSNGEPDIPTMFALHQNYPNPFNPGTTIEYDLPVACQVVVEIFNAVGQHISLVSSEVQGPGHATAVWSGHNDQKEPMSSGVYYYCVTALPQGNVASDHPVTFRQIAKMLLLK